MFLWHHAGMTRDPAPPQRRFRDYLASLAQAIGHADRREPLRAYVTGLCLPGDRKSVEPMAARVDPGHVTARHQSLHHFVASAAWDDDDVLRVARDLVLEVMERHGAVAARIVDDTGFPRKGRLSVGVARQYCGVLGKQENCQVAVTVTLANEAVSIPAAYALYLPESWAHHVRRRRAAGVPDSVPFRTKGQIALEQIAALVRDGVPLAPGRRRRMGRPPTRVRRSASHRPVPIAQLAVELPRSAWRGVSWRQGTRGAMHSRFACARIRPAHRDVDLHAPRPEEWLLIEWPRNEPAPTKFWLSTMAPDTPLSQLVRLAKLRWRIERDYLELKDEFGLDHYEGRGWRGFHHHGTLCIAAYAFLAAERARLSPPEPLSFLRTLAYPRATVRGALPVRPERHVAASIA